MSADHFTICPKCGSESFGVYTEFYEIDWKNEKIYGFIHAKCFDCKHKARIDFDMEPQP